MKDTYTCLHCEKVNSIYYANGREKEHPVFCDRQCSADYKSALASKGCHARVEDKDNVFNMKSFKDWFLRSEIEKFIFEKKVASKVVIC